MQRTFSSRQIGQIVGADPSSVNRWIDSSKLKAFRTPGGHRRVLLDDLIVFLSELKIPIPDELKTSGLSLLIVDDDEQYARSLRKALLRNNRSLDIQICNSAIEALIFLGAQRPDVVVIDVYMPGLDGIEVCTRIKSNPETQNVMVIANTGRPTAQLEKRLLEAGASAFLIKPFRPNVLLELISPRQIVKPGG